MYNYVRTHPTSPTCCIHMSNVTHTYMCDIRMQYRASERVYVTWHLLMQHDTFYMCIRSMTVIWCSVLQCVAVRCSALQCVAVCCSALQCVGALCIPAYAYDLLSEAHTYTHTFSLTHARTHTHTTLSLSRVRANPHTHTHTRVSS